jgi:hypothetical protein
MTDPFFESQIYKSESVRPTPNLLPQERSLCLDQDLCDIILKKKHTMADIRKIQAIYGKFDDKTQSLHREVVRFLQIRNEYGKLLLKFYRNKMYNCFNFFICCYKIRIISCYKTS